MFDAFDDDIAVDQSFLCDSPVQSVAHAASQLSPCDGTAKPTHEVSVALDNIRTLIPITAKETSLKSKLTKFYFVKQNRTNLNDGVVSLCPEMKKNKAKASIPEAENVNADLSVLQGIDFDSFDKDGFDFEDSNFDDTISISTPSNASYALKAADPMCDRIAIRLPASTNDGKVFLSSGPSSSKAPTCITVSVLANSKDSMLTQKKKNTPERTNDTFERNEVDISNQVVQSKRKFPGPAGLLPKFLRLPEPNDLYQVGIGLFNCGSHKTSTGSITESQLPSNVEMSCSQIYEDPFQKAPWLAMIKDLSQADSGQHLQILNKFNISVVLKQANNQKALSNLKFPVLCVVIHSMIKDDQPDVSAVFKDKTGSISGMICQKLMQEFTEQLLPGSVLVLKQIMVMKLSSKRHCLNITPLSIVSIYFQNDSGIAEHLALNPVSWGALLQEANESPPSHILSRPSSNSKILPQKPVPLSSSVVFQSPSAQVCKSGSRNTQTCTTPSVIQASVPPKLSAANSSTMVTVGCNTHAGSVIQRHPLRNILGGLGDNSVRSAPKLHQRLFPTMIPNENIRITESAPKEPLQKPSYTLSTGCDLADDPLWTDDDFESMLLDVDMGSAL